MGSRERIATAIVPLFLSCLCTQCADKQAEIHIRVFTHLLCVYSSVIVLGSAGPYAGGL